jgi:acyl carrier protein
MDNMKTEEIIIQNINDFLEEEFEVERSRLVPSADLKTTLDLDSLDYIDLVVAMEKNLQIKVDPSDLADIHTLRNLYDYAISKIKKLNQQT